MVKVWPYWIVRPRGFLTIAGGLALAVLLFPLAWRVWSLPTPVSVELTAGLFFLMFAGLWLLRPKKSVEGILILGTGELAEKLYREILHSNKNGGPKGLFTPSSEFSERLSSPGATLHYRELQKLTGLQGISRIVLAEPRAQDREKMACTLIACKLRGVAIEDAVDVYEKRSGKIWLEGLYPEWLIYSDGFRPSRGYLFLKRSMDLAGAVLLLLLTAPLLALIALAIRLGSRGPVLLKQVRVGQFGKNFVLYKFRSMREDAERNKGPIWAGERDERTTSVGRVLRKLHLDELPQLYNVLRGEMSLVGPRPERPCFVELLKQHIPYYDLRHCLKPGITGWAQVMYCYAASIQDAYEKLQYDLYYGKHMSLSCDLWILLKTVKVVVLGYGR